LDLELNKWTKAGVLPDFHIVTEQVNFNHGKQTITIFVQVNFEKNQFEVCMASNKGEMGESTKWDWLFKECVDIQNFHIKSAVMVGDQLVVTARGRPKDTFEQCCSLLMVFNAKTEGQLVTGFDKDFTFIKLDPIVYPELITTPQVRLGGGSSGYYCQLSVVQENNFQDFPRQILVVTIPDKETMSRDCSLIGTTHQRLIDMEF